MTEETKAKKVEDALKGLIPVVSELYRMRKERRTHPEGTFDRGGRWYPSDREDQEGDGTCVRSPSRRWPYSYMIRCRTRQHCRILVEAALAGRDVPSDVQAAMSRAGGAP